MKYTFKNIYAGIISFGIRSILISVISIFLSSFFIQAKGQIVINEVGIGAPCINVFLNCDNAGGGGEFIELFNKSGCNVNIGCYVLLYTGLNGIGWSVTLPNVTLAPGQYYLIGGHNSSKLFNNLWTNGTLTNTTTWKNNYNNNGADLDLGRANTSGKGMIIGNLIDDEGQITLFKPDGFVASSIAYNTGNYSGSYPVTFNTTTGCSITPVATPPTPTVTFNDGQGKFTSTRAGLYLDASGNNYVLGYGNNLPGSLTPGQPNPSQLIYTPAPSQPTISAGGPTTFCAGGSVTLTSSAAAGNQWYKDGTIITGANAQTYNATAAGNYTVTITDGYGCSATSSATTIIVNASPIITGTPNVCVGSTTQLTGSPTPGSWVSSNVAVATVSNSGLVTGIAVGTTTITYTDSNGCKQTATITVNPKPSPIIYHN